MTRICPAGRPIPDSYVRAAARTHADWPLLHVAAALRDCDTDTDRGMHDLASAYGVSYSTLRRWRRAAGLADRRRHGRRQITDDEHRRTVQLVEQLGSRDAAARALGLHKTTIRDRLRSSGHINPPRETTA